RPWVDVVLDELIVPELARRHPRVLVDPVDQRVFLGDPAPIDELARGDRIEHEDRRDVWVHAAQHVADVLAPVLLAKAERVRGGSAPAEDAYRAIGRTKSVLDVKRLPGAPLLVLGKRDAVVGVIVSLRARGGDGGD